MAAADNIAKALDLKEEGNTHFKAGDYKKAIAAYHQARARPRLTREKILRAACVRTRARCR